MKKVIEFLKKAFASVKKVVVKFITSLKAKNLKDIAIAILIFSFLIVCWRTYYLWQKGKKLEKENAINAQQYKEDQKIISKLMLFVKSLAKDIIAADARVAERDKKILDKENEKKQIEDDFEDFKNDLKKKSQKEKDIELAASLKRHDIDVKIVADRNYMEIVPKEREDLSVFVIDYEKIFTLHKKNEDELIPLFKAQINDLKGIEFNLKLTVDTNEIIYERQIKSVKTDLGTANSKIKNLKNKLFWRKVGEVIVAVLAGLILIK
jgi:hypothetical protein